MGLVLMGLVLTGLLIVLGVYLAVGIVFAVAFGLRGCQVIDPAAKTAGLAVRLLWLPAATLLWPYLWRKWQQAKPYREHAA